MIPPAKSIWTLLRRVAASWVDDYAPSMGAALAFYTMFSIAPLLLIVIAVAGLVFGQEAARGEIAAQLQSLMGQGAADAIQGLLASVHQPGKGTLATIVGVVLLVAGATSVFGELQNALDRIWRAPERRKMVGWLALARTRLLSFGMVMAIGFLFLVSLVASTVIAAMGDWWDGMLGSGWHVLAMALNVALDFVLAAVLFALIYKIMPRVRVQWRDVWTGAIFTAMLFSVGKFLIGLYLGRSGVSSGFGAAGSLVVVLLWVYYSAQIFLLGAEFTWVYANTFGSRSPRADRKEPLAAQAVPSSSAGRRPGAGGADQ